MTTMSRKLALGGTILLGVLGYLAYLGASSNWQYYLLVDECVGHSEQWRGKALRVSGRVAAGTLQLDPDHRAASFRLAGSEHEVAVTYAGTLPDNLAEGMDVLVEGRLQPDGRLQGHKIITRCASKYAPNAPTTPPTPGAANVSAPGRTVPSADQGMSVAP